MTTPPTLPRPASLQFSDPGAPPAIRTEGLTRTFRVPGRGHEEVHALAGVSLALEAGSFTAIVGASGSGKSTFMQCVAGLDQPTSGSVHLLGQETSALGRGALARFRADNVGFIFQDDNLVTSLSARDNVALPGVLRRHRLPRRDVEAALERVGLAPKARRLPRELSGGERQRVAVARVLAARPPLVFADEPTASLDLVSGEQVLDWLRESSASGSTVLMVTHDAAAASRADEVLVMEAGRVSAHLPGGNAAEVSAAVLRTRGQSLPEGPAEETVAEARP